MGNFSYTQTFPNLPVPMECANRLNYFPFHTATAAKLIWSMIRKTYRFQVFSLVVFATVYFFCSRAYKADTLPFFRVAINFNATAIYASFRATAGTGAPPLRFYFSIFLLESENSDLNIAIFLIFRFLFYRQGDILIEFDEPAHQTIKSKSSKFTTAFQF